MQYPTLTQLTKMTSEQRRQRLRGIDAVTKRKLLDSSAELLADIIHSGLRDSDK